MFVVVDTPKLKELWWFWFCVGLLKFGSLALAGRKERLEIGISLTTLYRISMSALFATDQNRVERSDKTNWHGKPSVSDIVGMFVHTSWKEIQTDEVREVPYFLSASISDDWPLLRQTV